MDFYSLGFLFVIVMVSGVIAYLADIGGRKLGKKRLSLFGLRPKYTAAVATVIGGMIASVLAIALVSIFSSPVRQWILDGSHAIEEAKRAQTQLDVLREQLKTEQSQLDSAKREKLATQAEIGKYQKSIGENEVTLGNQKSQISNEQNSIDTLRGDQIKLQSDLKQTKSSLNAKSQMILVDEVKIKDTDRKLRKNRVDLQKAEKEFEESSKNSKLANRTLLSKNSELTEAITKQTVDLASLKQEQDELNKTRATLQTELETKKLDLADLNSKLEDQTEELAKAQEGYGFFQKNVVIERTSPMVYHHLQEVCRVSEEANLSPGNAEMAVDSLLRKAQMEVKQRGATSAEILPRPDGTTADQIRGLLTKQLTDKPEEMVLIASAVFNTFGDELVPLDITLLANPTIYHRGDKIGECDVDGNGSDQLIVKQLQEFGSRLRERAKSDKMIPQGEDSFGSLSADQVLNLVDQVKQAGRRVRLQALVANDTHAADSLKLNFRIR